MPSAGNIMSMASAFSAMTAAVKATNSGKASGFWMFVVVTVI